MSTETCSPVCIFILVTSFKIIKDSNVPWIYYIATSEHTFQTNPFHFNLRNSCHPTLCVVLQRPEEGSRCNPVVYYRVFQASVSFYLPNLDCFLQNS